MSKSEMVRRVALAIGREIPENEKVLLPKGHPATFDAMARAAIEAMREPTEAMIDAGRDIGPDAPYGAAETAERWRTMIDAALKD